MRRNIAVIWVLCLLLSLFTQPVFAGTPQTAQGSGGSFATSPAIFTLPGKINTLVPLGDGRMLAGGSFTAIGSQSAPRSLAILKADGSLDTAFQVDPGLRVTETYAAALQADGKILIAGQFKQPPLPLTEYLLRLNPNGSVDDTFTPPYFSGPVYAILVDGEKLLIGGNFSTPMPRIARLNLAGAADPTFSGVGSGPDAAVRGIARQSSGQYVIAGDFGSYNSASQVGIARLTANGALESTFATGGYKASTRVAVLKDNSVVVGGEDICGAGVFAWYTSSGTLKPALDPDPKTLAAIHAILPLPDGGFIIGGWRSPRCYESTPMGHEGEARRYASDGSYRSMVSFGEESDVLALGLRSDGTVMAGGQGRPRTSDQVGLFDGLALLDLANDSLDTIAAFQPVVGDEAQIYSLSRYADGKLLVAGDFSHVNGAPHFGLARLLASGSLDTSFHPFSDRPGGWSWAVVALPDGRAVAGFRDGELYLIGQDGSRTDLSDINDHDRVSALAVQSDNKVLVGSNFGMGVRRLKADFSGEDPAFTHGETYGAVNALAVQGNKIFVAGDFSQYNSVTEPGLVRLNEDGSIDSGFTPPAFQTDVAAPGTLYSVAPLSSGDVLVGGYFATVGGVEHPSLVRLDSAGTLGTTFTSPAQFHIVKSIAVQGDGSIWVGGIEPSNFRNPLVLHLDADGQVDTTWQSAFQAAHFDGVVNAILCDDDGLGWAGGKFSLIDNRPFHALGRFMRLRGQQFIPIVRR
jgi:uncharacterized delta-60 repeat protein